MKFDISQAETQFAVLSTNLNSFVSRVIQEYEGAIANLQAENKKVNEELNKLKEKLPKEEKKDAN